MSKKESFSLCLKNKYRYWYGLDPQQELLNTPLFITEYQTYCDCSNSRYVCLTFTFILNKKF